MIGQLALNFPTTVYNDVPKGSFNYGGGGVNAWRSICGGPNGGSALLAQMGAPTNVKDEYMAWYEKTTPPQRGCVRGLRKRYVDTAKRYRSPHLGRFR